MKPGPYFLITLLLVAGGIFVYHNLVADSPRPRTVEMGNAPYDDDGLSDTLPGSPPEAGDPRETPLLHGGGNETLIQSNAAKLERLEKKYGALERLLAEAVAGRSDSGGRTESTGAPMPSLSPRDIVDTDNPSFDDDTIDTLSAYMDEINRRKQEDRQRARLDGELARIEMEISDVQRKSVIDETIRFQGRTREVMRRSFSPDEAGRDERRAAFQDLQNEYATVIKRLVPEESAEKILKSRITRGMGFYSSGFGGRTNRGTGRNRNR